METRFLKIEPKRSGEKVKHLNSVLIDEQRGVKQTEIRTAQVSKKMKTTGKIRTPSLMSIYW